MRIMKKEKSGIGIKILAAILILAGIVLLIYRYTDIFDGIILKNRSSSDKNDAPTDEIEYPEAKTSTLSFIPDSVVNEAYNNSSKSYIIYDVSSNEDASSLWIQPRTQADNVVNAESTLMKYDEDFFANFIVFSAFEFKADKEVSTLSFDIYNTSDRAYTGIYFSVNLLNNKGERLYAMYAGVDSLDIGKKATVNLKYTLDSSDTSVPVSFKMDNISLYWLENNEEEHISWYFD